MGHSMRQAGWGTRFNDRGELVNDTVGEPAVNSVVREGGTVGVIEAAFRIYQDRYTRHHEQPYHTYIRAAAAEQGCMGTVRVSKVVSQSVWLK